MSLSDKYGGNIDLEAKYGFPEPKKITDPSKTPLLQPGYYEKFGASECARDIRIEKQLYQDYINLLVDAKEYINNNRYKTAWDAFNNHKLEDLKYQVLSQDKKYALLMSLNLTYSVYDSFLGEYFPELLTDTEEANKRYWKYYPLDYERQRYVIINVKTGTFEKYFDELYTDIDETSIYIFQDGTIYCLGSKYLHNVPLDYLSKVLDESIKKINTGNYTSCIPTINASIKYKYDYSQDDIKKQRKYILSRNIN